MAVGRRFVTPIFLFATCSAALVACKNEGIESTSKSTTPATRRCRTQPASRALSETPHIKNSPSNAGDLNLVGASDVPLESNDPRSFGSVGVRVLMNDGSRVFCGGGIGASGLVLTAAHCLFKVGITQVDVVFSSDLNSPVAVRAEDYKSYPNYNGSTESPHDIGWVKFSSASIPSGGSAYRPVPLPRSLPAQWRGQVVTMVGFGKTGTQSGGEGQRRHFEVGADLLQTHPSYPNEVWLLPYSQTGKNSCSGDSGGPAFLSLGNGEWGFFAVTRGRRFGVNEIQSCESGRPVVTLIEPYREWIESSSGVRLGSGLVGYQPQEFRGSPPKTGGGINVATSGGTDSSQPGATQPGPAPASGDSAAAGQRRQEEAQGEGPCIP